MLTSQSAHASNVHLEPLPSEWRSVPESNLWRGLISGAFRVVETSCDLWSCRARVRITNGSELGRLERVLLDRVFQGEQQKCLALDLGTSTATVSQLIGNALIKLGSNRRVLATPLPVVLSALGHAGVVALPEPRVTRCDHERREHLEVSFAVLDPDRLSELSHGERQIALMLAWGANYRQIRESRGTCHSTVANQIASLSRKLGAHGRFELIRRWATRQWGRGNAGPIEVPMSIAIQ
jgi:DNA-binding NarL/FixJ family response regulator